MIENRIILIIFVRCIIVRVSDDIAALKKMAISGIAQKERRLRSS